MSDVLTTIAPVFGLIVLGFLAARTRLLSEAARAGLTEFVFTIAVPMLIFRTIVTAAAPGLGLISPLKMSASVSALRQDSDRQTSRPIADQRRYQQHSRATGG